MQATNETPVSQPNRTSNRGGRDANGRFARGARANPEGRPRGSRNRATLQMESLLEGRGKALTEKAIKMALEGDVLALRLCLERLLPLRRERSLAVQLPPPATAQDITAGFARTVEALGKGEVTASEVSSIAELLENARRAIETTDLALRLAELEGRLEGSQQREFGEQA